MNIINIGKSNIKITKRIINNKGKINGGVDMENVISIDKYIENTQSTECEWDIIKNICQKAIKRNGFTKDQVSENAKRMLREVRSEK
jgi:tryptophanyl-tRNA synthetase